MALEMEPVRGPLLLAALAAETSTLGRANMSVKEERRRRPFGEPSFGSDAIV